MICPKCKTLVSDNDTNCENCGANLSQFGTFMPSIEEIYSAPPINQPTSQDVLEDTRAQLFCEPLPNTDNQPTHYPNYQQPTVDYGRTVEPMQMAFDKPKPLLVALSVKFPLIGLFLWLIKDNKKELADMYGKPALWAFAFNTVSHIITTIILFNVFVILVRLLA